MIRRLLQRFQIDWDQFKALLHLSIRLDFRLSHQYWKKKSRWSPLTINMFFYALLGVTFALNIVFSSTPFFYTLLLMSYIMTMIAFSVMLEFGRSMLQVDDLDVLQHRPISDATYYLAKLVNILFYILMMTLALGLVPGILGACFLDVPWHFVMSFYGAALMANATIGLFIVAIYTAFFRAIKKEKFQNLLTVFQVMFTVMLIVSYQSLPKLQDKLAGRIETHATPLNFYPPMWYTTLTLWFRSQPEQVLLYSLVSVLFIFLFLAFSWRRFSFLDMHRFFEEKSSGNKNRSSSQPLINQRDFLKNRICPSPESKAGFDLTRQMFKSNFWLRSSVFSIAALPVIFLILAIARNELYDPFETTFNFQTMGFRYYSIYFTFFLISFTLRGLMSHRDFEASWLYHTLPIESPGKLYHGIKMAVLFYVMMPFFLLVAVMYAYRIYWVHAVQHAVTLFIIGLIAFSLLSFSVKSFPFSRPHVRGERMQRFLFLLSAAPFFIFIMLFKSYLYAKGPVWFLVQAILLCLWLVIEKLAYIRLNRNLLKNLYIES